VFEAHHAKRLRVIARHAELQNELENWFGLLD